MSRIRQGQVFKKFNLNQRSISVVIPNYNGSKLLEAIIPDLFSALKNTGSHYEVIIVDDCSTDDSISFIKEEYPQIILLTNDKNRGFSPTINKGIFAASHELVLLLNSDVKLMPDYIVHLYRYFNREDTFGVMGRIVGWDDDTIQDAAKYPSYQGAKIKTSGNYYLSHPANDDWLYSMYLSGANALIDRKKLMHLKGFNEIFAPFYVEDFELSLRAWRLGWRCYYDHDAICRHKTSTTIASTQKKLWVRTIYNRNKMFLHAIHLDPGKKALWFVQLFFESVVQLFAFKPYFVKSVFLFLKSYPQVKVSKRELKSLAPETGLQSVHKVLGEILASLKGREIERF